MSATKALNCHCRLNTQRSLGHTRKDRKVVAAFRADLGLGGLGGRPKPPMKTPRFPIRWVRRGFVLATKRTALHRRRDPIATNNNNGRLPCAIGLLLPARYEYMGAGLQVALVTGH